MRQDFAIFTQRFKQHSLLKVHPDKGGRKEDLQKLQAAKETWDSARKDTSKAGRPHKVEQQGLVVVGKASRKENWCFYSLLTPPTPPRLHKMVKHFSSAEV